MPNPPDGSARAVDLGPFAELVELLDRLRSPGGCPWYAGLTHQSLLPYAIEEVHELVEAVETRDRAGLREELGDLLLQVVLHARLAQEDPESPFGLDDVAADLAAKLRRRNPHVFGVRTAAGVVAPPRAEVLDVATVDRRYQQLKEAEKQRGSAMDGIPPTLPALARAGKVLDRTRRAGLDDVVAAAGSSDDLGDRLLAVVASAAPGVDAEAALRAAVRRLEARVRAAETERRNVHHVEGT